MKDKKELLKEKIESNKRYLTHANAVLNDAKRLLGGIDRPRRFEKQVTSLDEEFIEKTEPADAKSLGRYKSHINGKGWKKLRI